MKKLLLLTAVLSLALSGSGCRWCENLFRGARADQNVCPPMMAAPIGTPCAPPPCDPCAPSGMQFAPGPGS